MDDAGCMVKRPARRWAGAVVVPCRRPMGASYVPGPDARLAWPVQLLALLALPRVAADLRRLAETANNLPTAPAAGGLQELPSLMRQPEALGLSNCEVGPGAFREGGSTFNASR